MLGTPTRRLWRRVYLPSVLAEVVTGLRLSLTLAWMCVIALRHERGVGAMMNAARRSGRVDQIVVGMLVFAVIGLLADLALRLAARPFVRWNLTCRFTVPHHVRVVDALPTTSSGNLPRGPSPGLALRLARAAVAARGEVVVRSFHFLRGGGVMVVYLLLLAAIVVEVVAAVATRLSDGFTRPVPALVAVGGVSAAYYLLSLVLQRGMALGVAYAIWSAVGIALVATAGVVLGDRLSAVQVVGLLLVVGGVVSLELGG